MAAGLEEYDLAEAYKVDIFTEALEEGEPRTMVTSYFRHALRMENLTDEQMLYEYPQLDDCLDSASPTVADDGLELIRLHQRHAKAVISVMEVQQSYRSWKCRSKRTKVHSQEGNFPPPV